MAIVLVYAVSASWITLLAAQQVTPVHHVSAEQVLAWALLNARTTDELFFLVRLGLGDKIAAMWLDEKLVTGGVGSASLAVCYTAVVFDISPLPPGYVFHNVTLCVKP